VVTRSTAPLADARKVLVIGDDAGARERLYALLEPAGISVVAADVGGSGLKAFYAERPDLLLLDFELQRSNGFDALATIREMSDVPVIVLTALEGSAERAGALRAGADDCLTKPFDGVEMLARIEALLRRARPASSRTAVLEDDYVRIDRVRYRVEVLGSEVALTPTEFRMLATFAEHPGRVLGHAQLLELVWGGGFRDRDEVKLYVSYLRRKLGKAGVNPVDTVRGIGYRYRPHAAPGASS
jgi:two-component system OmpR family response regulator